MLDNVVYSYVLLFLDNVSFQIYGQVMEPAFKYWLSPDGQRAVTFIEQDEGVKIFTVSVPAALAACPGSRLDSAIYNLSVNLLNSESMS